MRQSRMLLIALSAAAVLHFGLSAANLQAASDTWTGAGDGTSWDTATANWSNGGTNKYTEGDAVTFNDTGIGHATVNLTAGRAPSRSR